MILAFRLFILQAPQDALFRFERAWGEMPQRLGVLLAESA
jgi:hypothetical protein